MRGVAAWLDPTSNGIWPPSVSVRATTRTGPDGDFELGGPVDPVRIETHREALPAMLGVRRVTFLRQVHGTVVHEEGASPTSALPVADASVTSVHGVALAILTADCLPILLFDRAGTRIAAAHAGWRGLAAGVLEETVTALDRPCAEIGAWLGPAIGQAAFEIGPEVRSELLDLTPGPLRAASASCFRSGRGDRWHADLSALATLRLRGMGVGDVRQSAEDAFSNAARYFSHRREGGQTGRQASLIWLSPPRHS